jgi:hypothetical protein
MNTNKCGTDDRNSPATGTTFVAAAGDHALVAMKASPSVEQAVFRSPSPEQTVQDLGYTAAYQPVQRPTERHIRAWTLHA